MIVPTIYRFKIFCVILFDYRIARCERKKIVKKKKNETERLKKIFFKIAFYTGRMASPKRNLFQRKMCVNLLAITQNEHQRVTILSDTSNSSILKNKFESI